MAYVIAHEVGHHVQNQLGIMDEYNSLRSQMSQTEFNELTVRLELQADYLAGVWAHYAENMDLLDEGDIQEAMNAASAVGDDRIQKQTQGYVVPDSFTHGTSEQRMRWFMKGFEEGDLDQWDTFSLRENEL
jgi:predicted metalloprotease